MRLSVQNLGIGRPAGGKETRPTDQVLMVHWVLVDARPRPPGPCTVSEAIKHPGDNQ